MRLSLLLLSEPDVRLSPHPALPQFLAIRKENNPLSDSRVWFASRVLCI
jgi:hypothetical protein